MATWTIPCREIADRINKRVENVVREIAFELFSNIVIRTPVDTGRLRANWNVSFGSPDHTVSDSTEPPDLRSIIYSMPAGGIVWMSNSLPYAATVEYGMYPNPPKKGTGKTINGYSTQAPSGMVRVSVRELETAVRRAANKIGSL